jgi:hypothetical protein
VPARRKIKLTRSSMLVVIGYSVKQTRLVKAIYTEVSTPDASTLKAEVRALTV